MLTFAGTTGDLRRSVIDSDVLSRTRHIHVSSYFLQRALVPELPGLFREARGARQRRPSIRTGTDRGPGTAGSPLLLEVDVFLPNEVEALSLARISVIDGAIARLRSSGAGTVVVKTAGKGAVGAQASDAVPRPAFPTQVVDSTGAGDSFDAGFLAGTSAVSRCCRCLEIGNACGALSTRGVGGTSTQPSIVEALEAIERGSVP